MMYIRKKDIDTIAELTAMVDGAIESVDGDKDMMDYWENFSKRVNDLEIRMIISNSKNKTKNK